MAIQADREAAEAFAKSVSNLKPAQGSDDQKLIGRNEINLRSRIKRRSRRGR